MPKRGSKCSEEEKKKNRDAHLGEKNGMWKGNNLIYPISAGHKRAKRRFPSQPCEICGNSRSERHHIDGYTLNNSPENIRQLCRHHHMEFDGRLSKLIKRNKEKVW